MGESKNFKMLESPLNQLQMYYGYLCDLLSHMWLMLAIKMVIFLSQTESTPKHFLEKKHYIYITIITGLITTILMALFINIKL
jgi:tetrahydromethanopterin S-methyltransferase subunit E